MSSFKVISRLAIVAIVAGIMFIWFGVFNVSAKDKHWAITETFLELVRDRSISTRLEPMDVPNLKDSARIKRGAANYDAMCTQCHLAPGVKTTELYEGLNPQPPVLYKHEHFSEEPKEAFWVIKNGIKMTGMPAWGISNSDEQIWDMIALISALDDMTAAQYQELVESGQHTHKGGGHASTKENKSHGDSAGGNAGHGHNEKASSEDHHGSNGHSTESAETQNKVSHHDKTPHEH